MTGTVDGLLLDLLEEVWDDGNAVGLDGWIGPGRGAGEVDDEARYARDRVVRKVLKVLTENGYGSLPESTTEWGAVFRVTGALYNVYHSREEAEDFVNSMNEVDADMAVMSRQRTPATYTEWKEI